MPTVAFIEDVLVYFKLFPTSHHANGAWNAFGDEPAQFGRDMFKKFEGSRKNGEPHVQRGFVGVLIGAGFNRVIGVHV